MPVADVLGQVVGSPQSTVMRAISAAPADPSPAQTYYKRNLAYVAPGDHTYNTALSTADEQTFRQWVSANNVPFDINAGVTDYDMRGFWKALQAGDPRAKSAIDPNDRRLHYPDYWKTPYHETFSAESQWADPKKAPHWNEKDQLVMPDGTVIFDDRAKNKKAQN